MGEHGNPEMSRRTFVKLGTGLLSLLPTVAANTFLLPFGPRKALAEEPAAVPTTHVVIVKRGEVGFVVMDTANNARVPVAGAKVSLTSRANGKGTQGTTDEQGKVLLDITELSEPAPQGTTDETRSYGCNASISIECPGYREWRADIVRLDGGTAYSFPTHRLEGTMPYPALVGFNGWDGLYTTNDFCSSPANDAEQIVRAELVGGAGLAVRLVSRDGKTVYGSGTADASGAVTLAKGQLLRRGAAGALPPGTAFSLAYDWGGTTYLVDLNFTVTENMAGASEPSSKDEKSFSPFNALPGFSQVHMPAGIPLIGNASIVPNLPTFPAHIAVDPFGYLTFALGIDALSYKNDSGTPDANGWKTFPRTSAENYYGKVLDNVNAMATRAGGAFCAPGSVNQIAYSRLIQATFGASLFGAARWDFAKGSLGGQLAAQGTLAFLLSLSENCMVGPFPVLVQFNLSLRMALAMAAVAFYKDEKAELYDWDAYHFDYSNSGVTFTIVISPSLSVGLGVAGVASISLRGTYTLTLLMGITKPHFLLGMKADATVVVQMFLFSATFQIWGWSNPAVYDSWASGQVANMSFAPSEFAVDSFARIPANSFAELAEYVGGETSWESAGTNGVEPTPEFARTDSHPFLDALGAANGMGSAGADMLFLGLSLADESYVAHVAANDIVCAATGLGGIRPSVDSVVAQNVFSDPRIETHMVGGKLYRFRIVSTMYENAPVSCVVVESADPTQDEYYVVKPYHVRDGAPMHAFDFAVHVPDPSLASFGLVVVGGYPTPDGTIAEQACAATHITYYNFAFGTYIGPKIICVPVCEHHADFVDLAKTLGDGLDPKTMSFCLSDPWLCGELTGTTDGFLKYPLVGVLVRSVPKGAEDTLFTDAAHVDYAFVYAEKNEPVLAHPFTLATTMAAMAGETGWSGAVHEAEVVRASARDFTYCLRLQEGSTSHYRTFSFASKNASPPVFGLACQDYDTRVRLVEWPRHDAMLCAHNTGTVEDPSWHLQSAVWDGPSLAFDDVGPTDFAVSDFAVDASGTYLFFPSLREGSPGYTYDDPSDPQPAPDVHEHRIMCCRLRRGRFCDPFVFGQLDHSLDSLHVLGELGSSIEAWNGTPAMCFASVQITDLDNGVANLWFTAVPEVSCATVLDVDVTMPLLSRACPAEFLVTLRNDGNTYLSGVTLGIAQAGQDVPGDGQWTRLAFSRDTLRESPFNPKDANGNLQDVEDDFALAPGKTSVYAVRLLLADDWEGEMDVTVRARDGVVAPVSAEDGMLRAASVDGETFWLEGRLAQEPLQVVSIAAQSVQATTDGTGLADAPMRVAGSEPHAGDDPGAGGTPDPQPKDTGNGAPGAQPGQAGGNTPGTRPGGEGGGTPVWLGGASGAQATGVGASPSAQAGRSGAGTLPQAGDAGGSAAGAALALAGAGLLAYSARRSALEREG